MTNPRKVLIGFSLSLIVIITMGCAAVLILIPPLRPYSIFVSVGVAAVGFGLLTYGGRAGSTDHSTPGSTRSGGQDEHPLSFFAHANYWGWILLLTAIPTFILTQHLSKPLVVHSKASREVQAAAEIIAPASVPKPVVATKFPQLSLNGLVCNGPRSTAIINGLTVSLGEKVEGVRVVAIERWGITVELDGRERNFTLTQ